MPYTTPLPDMTLAPLPADTSGVASPAQSVTVGPSPFTYAATARVAASVSGGTVSVLQYGRGTLAVGLGILSGGNMIEMNAGDTIKITWALTAPTLTIFPRA